MKLKYFKSVLSGAAFLLLCGCATQFMAIGDWAEPSDLKLNERSLAGVKVSVRCGHMDKNGDVKPQTYPLCAGLERHLASLGAEIVPKDQPGAALTVWYLEEGVVDKQVSAGSVAGLIFSAYIIPMVSSATSRVEFRITDGRGVMLFHQKVLASKVRMFGWSAWLALGKKHRQKELGQKFYTYVKNKVVTQAVNGKLVTPPEEPETPEETSSL